MPVPILKHRLELEGISHVVSLVSVALMEGGGEQGCQRPAGLA